jgi:competence protein ComEC
MAHLLTPLLLGIVLGTGAQLTQAILSSGLFYGSIMALGLVLWTFSAIFLKADRWRWPVVLMAATLLALGVTGLRALVYDSQSLKSELEGRDLVVTGVVAGMVDRQDAGLRFRLAVEDAVLEGQPVKLPARIDLGWYGGVFGEEGLLALQRQPPTLIPGERWQMTVRLKAPHGARNPHGFDYELWMWEQGVQASGYVRAGPRDAAPSRLGETPSYLVERWRQQVRDRIFAQVEDRTRAGLIAALVVGDQRAIERVDWDTYRATGVAHLMSISGLHVTMFAWLAGWIGTWLWRRSTRLCLYLPAPSAGLLLGLLLAAAYALFSGWGLPAQRTVIMLAVVCLLRLSGRRWPWPMVWLLACAAVVATDPWALLQAGFWLSFVAVGVLFASGSDKTAGEAVGMRVRLLGALREQWLITVALAPLSLLLFGQVSLIGLLANALAIPWVTLVVTPLSLLGVGLDLLWQVAGWAVGALSAGLGFLAALPLATLSLPQAPLWAGLLGSVGGLLLVMRLPPAMRLAGVALMLPVLLWQVPRPAPGNFDVLAPDIGQGNAVIVRTARHALVFDAGPRFSADSDAGHRVLVPLLRAMGLTVDTLVLSHRDTDHVGGAAALLQMQNGAELVSSIGPDHALAALRPVRPCLAGQRWQWDGVDFEFLHPREADDRASAKSNALSCVLRIGNAQATVLLTGDIEQAQEALLVQTQPNALSADLLLVPHHGSRTSSSEEFLDAVHPRLALVQAGYRNRYGHPAAAVMDRYRDRQIPVFDSPHCGAAQWQSADPGQLRCERAERRRYWQHRLP